MNKLFWKIRQKMLAEGRFKNYLLYALGEIILVVIGILIALQINNWNIERKNEDVKRTYYVQILQDLEKDEALMIKGNASVDAFFERLESYQESFKNNELPLWVASAEIGKVFSPETIQGSNFEVNSNTMSTLINTGDIKLIPLEIRNMLLDFKYKQAGLIDYMKSQTLIISSASLQTQKLYGGANLPTRIAKYPKLMNHYSQDEVALQSLLELEAILYEQAQLLKNVRERGKALLVNIESLKEVLHKELEK